MKRLLSAIIILGACMSTAAFAKEEVFANGVRMKAISRDYTQTVSMVIFIKGGLFRESEKNNGVGSLFARTWLKSGELMEIIEFYGGVLSSGLANDFLEISLSISTENLDHILPYLKQQLSQPKFTKKIFDPEKDIILGELNAEKDDPNSIAFQLFTESTYENTKSAKHPYALKTDGTIESVSKLTLKDIEDYYKNEFSASDMIVAVAGNFSEKQLKTMQDIFKELPKGKKITINCANSDISKTKVVRKSDPRIQQSKLFLAYAAPEANSKEYLHVKVLSEVLGGGMSSPYFTTLRKEKGYAYSVGTTYPSRICTSRFTGYIGLQPENVEDAIDTMKALNINAIKNLTEEDLKKAKNHLIGVVLTEAETNSKRAWYAAFFENVGLGFDHMDKYIEQLQNVKKEDILKTLPMFSKPETVFIYDPAPKK